MSVYSLPSQAKELYQKRFRMSPPVKIRELVLLKIRGLTYGLVYPLSKQKMRRQVPTAPISQSCVKVSSVSNERIIHQLLHGAQREMLKFPVVVKMSISDTTVPMAACTPAGCNWVRFTSERASTRNMKSGSARDQNVVRDREHEYAMRPSSPACP